MVKVFINGKMEILIEVIGKKIVQMEMDIFHGMKEIRDIKENLKKVYVVVLDNILLMVHILIQVIGKMIKEMEMEKKFQKMDKFMKEIEIEMVINMEILNIEQIKMMK